MSEDDWGFDEQPASISRYKGESNDLSAEIAQGQQIKDLRYLAGMSPSDLAAQVGLTFHDLLALEAGLVVLRKAQASRIAGALGVKFADLWLEEGAR